MFLLETRSAVCCCTGEGPLHRGRSSEMLVCYWRSLPIKGRQLGQMSRLLKQNLLVNYSWGCIMHAPERSQWRGVPNKCEWGVCFPVFQFSLSIPFLHPPTPPTLSDMHMNDVMTDKACLMSVLSWESSALRGRRCPTSPCSIYMLTVWRRNPLTPWWKESRAYLTVIVQCASLVITVLSFFHQRRRCWPSWLCRGQDPQWWTTSVCPNHSEMN